MRVAVCVSGGGSNLEALFDAFASPDDAVDIALVLSDRASSGGLERARWRAVPAEVLAKPDNADEWLHQLEAHQIELVVLASGRGESGCTVHLVDEEYDRGPILAQRRVPVLPDDTVESLAARVQAAEHQLLPAVVREAARRGRPVPLR